MRYPNFYECLQEAQARLFRTVVLYGDQPYFVLAITDHKKDGIFRMWLVPIESVDANDRVMKEFLNLPASMSGDHPGLGKALDDCLEKYPDVGVLRKHMNSPHFNRFRPFHLGMCSVGTQVCYVERQPTRPQMSQGLTKSSLRETLVTTGSRQDNPKKAIDRVDIYSTSFKNCILGDHYPFSFVLEALKNPKIANDALSFHREFALVRGPMDMLFLGYRTEIIGVLSYNDASEVRLGREFRFCREVVEELSVFNIIK